MKALFNATAAGLLGMFLWMPAFARAQEDAPAGPEPVTDNVHPSESEADRCAGFYANILENAAVYHLNGRTTLGHRDMAQAALSAVLQGLYEKGRSSGATFTGTGRDREISSIIVNRRRFSAQLPSGTSPDSYIAQARALEPAIRSLSQATGMSMRELYEDAVNGALREAYDGHTAYFDPTETKKERIELNMPEDEPETGGDPEDGDGTDKPPGPTVMDGAGGDAPVESRLIGRQKDIAYLKLHVFAKGADAHILTAMEALRQEAEKRQVSIRALILDLRDNGGGLLDQAQIISDYFVTPKEGEKDSLLFIDYAGDADETIHVDDVSAVNIADATVVVLQNYRSASAAELTAAVLQDSGATTVGTRTHGKGSGQACHPIQFDGTLLSDAEREAGGREDCLLKITCLIYYPGQEGTPQGCGVMPDIAVDYSDFRNERERGTRREGEEKNPIAVTGKTRAHHTPDWTCKLRGEYAGYLSAGKIRSLPPELLQREEAHNLTFNRIEIRHVFDADLGAALHHLDGGSPYMYMIDNRPPAAAPPPAPGL